MTLSRERFFREMRRYLGRGRELADRDDLYVATVRSGANVEGVAVDVFSRQTDSGRDVFLGLDRVTLDPMGVASSVPELTDLRKVRGAVHADQPATVAEVVLAVVKASANGADSSLSDELQSVLSWRVGSARVMFDAWRDPDVAPDMRVRDLSWIDERVLPLCLVSSEGRECRPMPVDPAGHAVFLRTGDERMDRVGGGIAEALSRPPSPELIDLWKRSGRSMKSAAHVPDITPFRFGLADRFLMKPIRIDGVVDRELERVVLAEAVDAFDAVAKSHEGSSVWLAATIRKKADWSVSWAAVDRDGSVAGFYLLSPGRLENRAPVVREDLQRLSGVEGNTIVTTPRYKGMGIGSVLKSLPGRMGYGYVFGEAMSSLENVDHWRRRREVVHASGRSTFTLEILDHDLRNMVAPGAKA